jgi:cytochrome P450
LGNGLVATEGDEWKFHRTLISPVFTPQNVSKMLEIMIRETKKYVDVEWKKLEKNGSFTIKNASSEISKITLRIIAASAFGTCDDQFFDEMAHLWEDLVQDYSFACNSNFFKIQRL